MNNIITDFLLAWLLFVVFLINYIIELILLLVNYYFIGFIVFFGYILFDRLSNEKDNEDD